MIYKFTWSALVTDAVLDRVRELAGLDAGVSVAAARPALVSILQATGGQPFVMEVPAESARQAWVLQLLGEAVTHTLAAAAGRSPNGGYKVTRTRIAGLGAVAEASPVTQVNWATAAEIEQATGSSPGLCESIVAERRAHGAFGSLDELDARMKGVTVRNRPHFASALAFDDPARLAVGRAAPTGNLRDDLRALLALQPALPSSERLTAALEAVASSVALEPHPATRANRRRELAPPTPPGATRDCDWVGVLFRSEYYEKLPALFADAKSSIEVCMFHIAFPSDNHPTRLLIDALAAAHDRGVTVRVLVDRDRENDPYRSTLVNSRAKAALQARGVSVRSDAEDRLLHSKFVVIDQKLSLIGSHNWSEGSYFEFDDLTLALASPTLAADLHARFDVLWAAGA